jgi:hypothetical protein
MSLIQVSDPMARLRAIKQRGGKIVFINPRRIESATPETGDVIQIRPDKALIAISGNPSCRLGERHGYARCCSVSSRGDRCGVGGADEPLTAVRLQSKSMLESLAALVSNVAVVRHPIRR